MLLARREPQRGKPVNGDNPLSARLLGWGFDVEILYHSGSVSLYLMPRNAAGGRHLASVSSAAYYNWSLDEREEWIMKFVRKLGPVGPGGAEEMSDDGSDFRKSFPAVHEFMTMCKWPDGRVRKTSTLLLFVEDCQFKVCFTDRDAGYVLWSTGKSVEDCLQELETAVASPDVVWRKQKQFRGR